MKPETKLEQLFASLVLKAGGMTEKVTPTRAGMPDRLVIYGGRIFLVELKTKDGHLRPVQVVWHDRAEAQGVKVWTLYGEESIRLWVMMMADAPAMRAKMAAEEEEVAAGLRRLERAFHHRADTEETHNV
ncbi:VRR-NUC domain-containing protein [Tessaracoccus sp.]